MNRRPRRPMSMLDLSNIKRCADISETHVIEAAKSRDEMRKLLLHASKVSRPGEGASKVLLVFARLATSSGEWIDGDLRVDLISRGEMTDVDVFALAGGIRERLFATFTLDAPIDEFVRAVRLVPHMIGPLKMHVQSDEHLVFIADDVLIDDAPPDSVEIGDIESDFGSLRIEVGDVVPESESREPLKGSRAVSLPKPPIAPRIPSARSGEKRAPSPPPAPRKRGQPTFDPDVHTRPTRHRMAAISREALRSDLPPPATTRPDQKPSKVEAADAEGETSEKHDDDFDEGWE